MAEATTEITVTPKQLGKHLRSIRRKKGLSLSEVARGAGLSRRELVNYERGKAPIPESDLWVLAGSCGVDVSELMPTTPSMELTAAASSTSVGDTVSALRKGQEDAGISAYLHTLHKLQALPAGKRIPVKEKELEELATALGSTPRSIEQKLQEVLQVSPDEAERLRAMILVPPNGRGKPRALAAAPSVLAAQAALEAASAPAPAPTPVVEAPPTPPIIPVPTPTVFAAEAAAPVAPVAPEPAPEPQQTFPVAPAAFLDQPLDAPLDAPLGHNVDVFEELARLPEPVPLGDPSAPLPDLLAPQADPFGAPFAGVPAIGPPEGAVELVDSAMPAAASSAVSSGAAAWNAAEAPPIDVAMRQGSSTWDLGEPPLVAKSTPTPDATTWETDGWQPPSPDGDQSTPAGFWEGTDDWTPPPDADSGAVTEIVDRDAPGSEPIALGEDTWAGTTWDPNPWASSDPAEEWPQEPADRGAWDHRPDPAAVDTGFYVDWGTPETETPPAWDVFADATTAPTPADASDGVEASEPMETTDTSALFDAAPAPTDGDIETVTEPATAWDPWSEPTDTVDEVSTETFDPAFETTSDTPDEPVFDVAGAAAFAAFAPFETTEPAETAAAAEVVEPEVVAEVEAEVPTAFEAEPVVDSFVEPTAELAPISWRAEGSQPAPEASPAPTAFDRSAVESTGFDLTGFDPTAVESTEFELAESAPPQWDAAPAWPDAAETAETTDSIEAAEAADSTDSTDSTESAESAETAETAESAESADPTESAEPAESAWITPTGETEPATPLEAEPEPERAPVIEEFVTAGPDWQLGNALPLVEVRGQGGLVMRRADERWALADVTTTPDFVAEVEVDFRSGPGLGVLFRASTDDEGRMSGYSFDIDPIYDGGGYLVRQWQANRELWNPIARVSGDDPASMYGTLLVRIEVVGEHLSAQVNGVEVLAVENLKQASADRGRDGATGDRVGVQAWSSSDLVIDTARVASR